MPRLRIAACQLNTVVGDLDGNAAAILAALDVAEAAGADVAAFPELAITGYPPEDLLLKPGFVNANLEVLEKIASRTGRCAAVIGFVDPGRDLYNAAAVCAFGQVQGTYRKRLLPNYSVFDEQRYFAASTDAPELFVIGGVRVGISIWIRPPAGPSSSSTSTPRRTTPAGWPSASACWRRVLPTRVACSSTSTRSAARTSSSSTARRWCSTPTASCSPGRANSSRTR